MRVFCFAEQFWMNRTSYRNCAVLSAALPLAFSFFATCSQTPDPPKDQPIRTMVDLVLFNVTVQDQETETPVEDLGSQDIQVLDDGHPVETAIFASRRSHRLSPTTIWFLVNCPEEGGFEAGSRFMAGKSSLLRPALDNLDSDDTIGVAHWCDNGDAMIDLAPTQNREAPLSAIETILHRKPVEPAPRAGELALQRTLAQIVDNTGLESRYTLPVIVLLYDGSFALPKDEAEVMAKRLLYKRAVAYQIRGQLENLTGADPTAHDSSIQFISTETGGRVLVVSREDYLKAMNSIVDGLHFGYTLGVYPRSRDKQWHQIRVRLTEAALQKHKPVLVECGAGYLAVGSYGSVPPYSISNYQKATNPQLDPGLAHVVDSPTLSPDIRFDAKVRDFIGLHDLAEFTFRVDGGEVAWVTLPNGDRRSRINIVFASFSEEGKKLKQDLVQFELTRDEVHLPITGDGPFIHAETVILPDNASRIRLAVRDVATGRIGVRDFSLKEILDAPKGPAVIR